jgi:hypothetical protein
VKRKYTGKRKENQIESGRTGEDVEESGRGHGELGTPGGLAGVQNLSWKGGVDREKEWGYRRKGRKAGKGKRGRTGQEEFQEVRAYLVKTVDEQGQLGQ